MEKWNLKKMLLCAMLILSMAVVLPVSPSYAAGDDNEIALTISGDGVNQEVKLTLAQLKALPQVTFTYSGYNHWPSLQVFKDATGPTLESVLQYPGLNFKSNATMVKFAQSGGGFSSYTIKELMKDQRYYYPDGSTGDLGAGAWPPDRTEEGKTEVPTIICLSYKDDDNNLIELENGKLLYGQRSPLEPTACKSEQKEGFVGNGRILVTTETPETWEAPDASVPPGWVVPGTKVKLQHGDGTPYGAIVYYTLDGSEPTVKSNIANISYPNFQPELNAPVPITQSMTIKTRTIGVGKADSPVATFEYKLGTFGCRISGDDLITATDYAVEALKEMVPSTLNFQTIESKNTVDLSGKGVLLETLFDQLEASELWKVKFVTVNGYEYEGGTVKDLKTQKCMLAYEVNTVPVADVSGAETTYLQILRNQSGSKEGNRLKNITLIKLVNVDEQISISSVKLLNCKEEEVKSVAAGGGYRIETKFTNKVKTAKDALLIFQVRHGSGATESGGGENVGYAAVQTIIAADGGSVTAEFTIPAGITGKAYVDISVLDNVANGENLGNKNHSLSFDIIDYSL